MNMDRLKKFLAEADQEDILEIIIAAAKLEAALYSNKDTIKELFRLRKALEDSFGGHDMPDYFEGDPE